MAVIISDRVIEAWGYFNDHTNDEYKQVSVLGIREMEGSLKGGWLTPSTRYVYIKVSTITQ